MSVHNSRCLVHQQDKFRQELETCIPVQPCIPVDTTRVPPMTRPPMNPMDVNCGCPPLPQMEYCCNMPSVIEARILKRPMKCVKQPCNFCIPAVPCNDPPKRPRSPQRDPLCFNWTVDEAGPNDSYGHNGLNWYDWSKMRELNQEMPTSSSHRFTHAGSNPWHIFSHTVRHRTGCAMTRSVATGLSEGSGLISTRDYLCRLPLICYSRSPAPAPHESFPLDVNYFRDWRSCTDKTSVPLKPPYAQWATNQHL